MLNKFIKKLNLNQKKAVLTVKGPVRVIAGAGSGKTSVIIKKIVYLISYCKLKPWRICAVTFTNRATNEMKELITKLIGEKAKKCNVSTYHSLCVKILRSDIVLLNFPQSFNIIDAEDQSTILKKIYKESNLKYDSKENRNIKNRINNWKNEFITPNQALDINYEWTDYKRWAFVYKKYQERLNELISLDFDDLILFTYRLFLQFPDVLKKWQNTFDYYLIDEFQDTNNLQFDIIKLLAQKHNNITVVGDPDQTIYSWRGAKINLIINFDKHFRNTETIILNENYRSSKNILSLANHLIVYNNNRITKDLFTTNNFGIKPILYHAANSQNESDFVAEKINMLVKKNKEYDYKDILVLYRANNYLSRNLELSLTEYNISYYIFRGFKFYERKEIKDTLSLLKAIVNNERLSIERVLLFTPKIGSKAIEQLNYIIINEQVSFSDILTSKFYLLPKKLQSNLIDLHNVALKIITLIKKTRSIKDIILIILDKSKYLQRLKNNLENEKVQNIMKLVDNIDKFDYQNSELSGKELINKYLQLISLQTNNDNKNKTENRVSLMTIHNAKGIEKKVVFIIGLNEGVFPSIQAIKNNIETLEEERRTLYVAITRAKELLYLSYTDGFSFITNNECFPSRFIKELNKEYIEQFDSELILTKTKYQNNNYGANNDKWKKSLSSFSNKLTKLSINKNIKWNVGESIEHEIFGRGFIIKIIGQNIKIVFGSTYGSKIILFDSKIIKKITN